VQLHSALQSLLQGPARCWCVCAHASVCVCACACVRACSSVCVCACACVCACVCSVLARTISNRAMKDLDMELKLGFSPPNAIWKAKAHARTKPIMAPRYLHVITMARGQE
jgi:hypothetical protein